MLIIKKNYQETKVSTGAKRGGRAPMRRSSR